MKIIKYIIPIVALSFIWTGCEDFLEKEPLGQETDKTFFKDPENAVLGVNAIYDAISWDEGGVTGSGHNYEWMFTDIISDDAFKGSTPGDFIELRELERWEGRPSTGVTSSRWNVMFAAIYRANEVILNLPESNIDEDLKNRLLGEAYFLRGYAYLNLVTKFGGLPLIDRIIEPSEWGQLDRASVAATYAFIDEDFAKASELLPLKSEYALEDVGRATKGAARAFLARSYMYQIGTDNSNQRTWQDVYNLTNEIINSNQYSLEPNYAKLFEMESENGQESIFEIQYTSNLQGWGPEKTGTTNSVIQGNRDVWGWGFNNPSQLLVDAFEEGDPRLAVTVYKDGDIVVGESQRIDASQNDTGYLNRKAFLEPAFRSSESKDSPKNIMMFRYADIILMKAEAAYHLSNEDEARDLVNSIRERARQSTRPKGSTAEGATDYVPYDDLSGVLPDIAESVTGQELLEAIWHERRVELAMEKVRFYDLVRTGRYLDAMEQKYGAEVRANAQRHSIQGFTNPIPVFPIPLNEAQDWGITQNPEY